jgi:hypothetical protein
MTAIRASFVKYNMLADGTLRVIFDVHPNERKIATDLLQQPGDPFAFARLTEESAQKAAQDETIRQSLPTVAEMVGIYKQPTGQLCRQAIGYCKLPKFWEWLETLDYYQSGDGNEDDAKKAMLEICNKDFQIKIESRRDFDSDQLCGAQFIMRIRDPYRAWAENN